MGELRDEGLLVRDVNDGCHPIGLENFQTSIILSAKEYISGEDRKQGLKGPTRPFGNTPGHRKKILDLAIHQVIGERFLVPALAMGNPPLTGELCDRFFQREDYGRVVTLF